jgi:23S rRNA pseudouridine1911/1915/1917 synthase
MEVIYCDNHVLVVRKPACLPMVPDASGDESLLERARAWVKAEYSKPGDVFLGVVHRLDRPVSGVVVLARTSKAAARLSAAFAAHEVDKLYWGIVSAKLPQRGGRVEHWLSKDRSRNHVAITSASEAGAKLATTDWSLLARSGQRSLVQLRPRSGRAHQLRVAMASLGAPLLGDLKYGADGAISDHSIGLHAHSLQLAHPTKKTWLTFRARSPEGADWSFDACIAAFEAVSEAATRRNVD